MPLAARGPVSTVLGRDSAGYRVAGFHAGNPAQRLSMAFSPRGVTLFSGAGHVRLALAGFGYASAVRPTAAVSPVVAANRVSYAHPGVREWYANGPLGLEQGFDVLARPAAGSGPLTLLVGLAGNLRARIDRGGVLLSGRGVRLRYGGLVVTDARGRVLRAWLQLAAGRVLIQVADRGAVYPVRVDPFVQQGSKLSASDETGLGVFGWSVALSSDGSTALVGGYGDNGGLGAAWVFTRSGSTWTQQGSKLTASDEAGPGDFGGSVALSSDGSTALIGGGVDNNVGAAWVFTRSGSTWTQQGAKLTVSDSAGDFGGSVALSSDGSTALIGDGFGVGGAWAFTRLGSTWTQQGAKLTASDEIGSFGMFGASVALSSDGSTALIGGVADNGGVGAAWVFTRSGSTWTQQGSKLTASDETGLGGFGVSVALSSDGSTALIGGDNGGVGAAWVFTRSGSTWAQQGSKLTASDETGPGEFGGSVALSSDGSTALIGGSVDNNLGAAWVFTRSGSTWTQQGSKLTASDESGLGEFGRSVALSSDGSTALIGGGGDNGGLGAAWVFANATSPSQYTLTVSKAGSGSGSVTSQPAGINCGAVCSYAFDGGTTVTLTATPVAGVSFAGWSGGGCSGTSTCTLTISTDQPVTATFDLLPPSNPPTATTSAASSLFTSGATLNGTVNPLSQATTYHFEYGTSTAYGSRAPASDAAVGSDGADHSVSRAVSGLVASTTYHYRVVATNATGTSYGADRTFATQALPPPVASVPGLVGTLGARLKFTFACKGAVGQRCQGQATASAIEKLSADGKKITGVLASKPRKGRYRLVSIANGNLTALAGAGMDVSIGLNSTGQMLRNKFKNVPADVKVTATVGGRTTTIKTAKVTFGPDPPKVSIAGTPTSKRSSVTVNLRCRGLNTQFCRGTVTLTTFEKLSANGKTITGLAPAPSGNGKLVTIAAGGWSIKAGRTLTLIIGLNATGKSLLAKFGKIPATLKITPAYNGYTLTPTTTKITLKR
jgi:hypothetical protein